MRFRDIVGVSATASVARTSERQDARSGLSNVWHFRSRPDVLGGRGLCDPPLTDQRPGARLAAANSVRADVIVAPDKFKESLTAVQVAGAVATGIRSHCSGLSVRCLPIADGSDGTLAAVQGAGFKRVVVSTPGPTGERISAAYARRRTTAVIDLAEVVGSRRLPDGRPNPRRRRRTGSDCRLPT